MEENESDVLRVHILFKKTVLDFIKEFEKKNGIEISTTKATKIIRDKITASGGLTV